MLSYIKTVLFSFRNFLNFPISSSPTYVITDSFRWSYYEVLIHCLAFRATFMPANAFSIHTLTSLKDLFNKIPPHYRIVRDIVARNIDDTLYVSRKLKTSLASTFLNQDYLGFFNRCLDVIGLGGLNSLALLKRARNTAYTILHGMGSTLEMSKNLFIESFFILCLCMVPFLDQDFMVNLHELSQYCVEALRTLLTQSGLDDLFAPKPLDWTPPVEYVPKDPLPLDGSEVDGSVVEKPSFWGKVLGVLKSPWFLGGATLVVGIGGAVALGLGGHSL